MKISKIPGLGRFGTFIDDLDFNHLSDEEWMEIGRLHLNSLVTILRNVRMDPDQYPGWIAKWGGPRYSFKAHLEKKYNKPILELFNSLDDADCLLDPREKNLLLFARHTWLPTKSGPGMHRVQSGFDENGMPRGWFPEGELKWHFNEPGRLIFVPGAALYGQTNMVGSATGFLTTVDWYEQQSESFRSELDEMIVVHKFIHDDIVPGMTNQIVLDSVQTISYPEYEHEVPLIVENPAGLRGTHCYPGSAYAIKGMSQKESDRLFEKIYNELMVDEYIYDHWYQQNNDICLFDNSVTLHRRLGSTEGRMAYRVAFDYSNLQDKPWIPFPTQGKFARKYIEEINEQIKIQGITDFKLPGLLDYVKTFFY